MIIEPSDIRLCLDKARIITEHYDQYVLRNGYPRSIDDLIWICETYLKLKISINELPLNVSAIRAACLSTDVGYEIYLLTGMDETWKRLALTKEIFHVILNDDDEQYHNIEIYQHIREVAESFPERDSQPAPSVVCELMAEIAALEFLFPYSERVLVRNQKPINYHYLVERYNIPQYYIENYLSDTLMRNLGAFVYPGH